MTFSAILKKDLSRLPFGSKACQRAELSGMIGAVATITVTAAATMTISIKTENPAVAARCYQLMKNLYQIKAKIKIEKTRKFKEHRAYRVVVEEPWTARIILEDCQILSYNGNQAFLPISSRKNSPSKATRPKPISAAFFSAVAPFPTPKKPTISNWSAKRPPKTASAVALNHAPIWPASKPFLTIMRSSQT